ncbi:MAG: hypothetical protein U9Q40_09680 [Campylobacterota bacterium]|nr:hypothetical protein [Campylobacterota bacterium]
MLHIEKKVVKTKDIQVSLREYADANLIPLDECDFTLKQVDNYVKDSANNAFALISKETLSQYTDKDKILNEHIEFNQLPTVILKHSKEKTLKLNYEISLGEHASHPKIILKSDSIIPYKKYAPKDMLRLIYAEFNKIKVLNSILINIFDEEMKKNLKAFIKHLYAGKFKKNLKLPLFNGIEPVVTRESKLVYWFKEKETETQVIEVDAYELLIEYKKPIFGKNGLNAYGKEVHGGTGNNSEDLQANIDPESITIEENEKSKYYKSKKRGYLHFDRNTFCVNNQVKMSKISRNNTAIASEEENNIEVRISQNDITKDSIGEGVELISETIHVSGHIGAKSILEAINLQIDGVTHQDSTQYAKYAEINRHKGTLRCHEAKVSLLEGGKIHASKVNIENCLGGSIYAQDVTIGLVKSNLKVYASNSITIRHVSGEDNLFKINYRDVPILDSKLNLLESDIEELKYKLEEAKKHTQSKIPLFKEKIKELRDEQNEIRASYLEAKISIERPLNGLNNIVFVIDDENEIKFKTDALSYTPFYLECNEDTITLKPVDKSISINNN